MKTKVVYVLVSDSRDCYYEQMLVSLFSLRKHNTDISVEIVTDERTSERLAGKRGQLNGLGAEIIAVSVPDTYSLMQKSRYLKTRLRETIKGDYIYIDTDTVICGSLKELDGLDYDLCAVADMNRPFKLSAVSGYAWELAKKTGWGKELSGEPYYNSGVLYVKDTPIAHQFYERWFLYWSECVSMGINKDQAGLCRANKSLGHPIHEIGSKWNCQINSDGLLFINDALIIHYFNNNFHEYLLARKTVQESIKDSGKIPQYIINFLDSPRQILANPNELLKVRIKKMFYPIYKTFRIIKPLICRKSS